MLAVAFVYNIALPFFWGNDPTSELGTLSLLCEDRKLWFWAWGLLTAGSITLNAQYMYRKFSYKSKILDAFCILSIIGVCCIALTLGHSIADWNPKRILHWVATGVFIVFLMASVVLFFIFNIKKHRHFPILTVCSFLILAAFGVLFAAMGKSAVMEMVPIGMVQILLFVVNFTPLIKAE